MVKRYAFWRTSTGASYNGVDEKFAPTEILAEIGKASTLHSNSISWPLAAELHHWELAICASLIIVDDNGLELGDNAIFSVVKKAISNVVKKTGGGKSIQATAFINAVNHEVSTRFRKKQDDYYLVTSLSASKLPFKSIKVSGCTISRESNRMRLDQPSHMSGLFPNVSKHVRESGYVQVKVKTAGRDVHEAVDKALNSLNQLRGLWTLGSTYNKVTLTLGSIPDQPVGNIRLGPVHVLYREDSSLVDDFFWYEPSYVEVRKIFDPENWGNLEEYRKKALRCIEKSPYKMEAKHLLMRYATALDFQDFNVSFMQLWGILEKMTDTVAGRYDETIRRAVSFCKNPKIEEEKLHSMRLRRNQYVHASKGIGESDQMVYMMKSYVDPHLNRLLLNTFRMDSISDYGNFLSLPRKLDTLKKRNLDVQKAIKLRENSFKKN